MSMLPSSSIDLRHLSAASAFAASRHVRYYLAGVLLEISARTCICVSTDGSRLIAIQHTNPPGSADNGLTGAIFVPTEQCAALKLARRGPAEGIIRGTPGAYRILHDGGELAIPPSDSVFPHWRAIVPQRIEAPHAAHFDFAHFAEFSRFADRLGLPRPRLVPDGPDRPALVCFPGRAEVIGLLSPLPDQSSSEWSAPDWAGEPAAARREAVEHA